MENSRGKLKINPVYIFLLILCAAYIQAGSADDLINAGRIFNSQADHKDAINAFESVLRLFPERGNEVLKELADQYKWDGKLEEAVSVYLKALQVNPEDSGARLGYAQALAWQGKKKEALIEYNTVLKNDPKNIEALCAKAETLSWDDRLEEALLIYEEVLKIDQRNMTARNGEARMNLWQGYTRTAENKFLKILAEDPANTEAMKQIANACHWTNRDEEALKWLAKLLALEPGNNDALKLEAEIKHGEVPAVREYNSYSFDSNNLGITSFNASISVKPQFSSIIEGIFGYNYFSSTLNTNALRAGGRFTQFFSNDFEVNSYLYAAFFNEDYWFFLTNSWFTWKPGDILRFDISFDRENMEDINSILNKIVADSLGFSVSIKPDRFSFLSAKYKKSYYSDSNIQNTLFSKFEYRLQNIPLLKAAYNFYYSDFDLLLNSGYFNPKSILSNTLGLSLDFNSANNLMTEVTGSFGYEHTDPGAWHPVYYFSAGVNYTPTENWKLFLKGEYFSALPDELSTGYIKKAINLSITYNFNTGEEHLPDGSRKYRE